MNNTNVKQWGTKCASVCTERPEVTTRPLESVYKLNRWGMWVRFPKYFPPLESVHGTDNAQISTDMRWHLMTQGSATKPETRSAGAQRRHLEPQWIVGTLAACIITPAWLKQLRTGTIRQNRRELNYKVHTHNSQTSKNDVVCYTRAFEEIIHEIKSNLTNDKVICCSLWKLNWSETFSEIVLFKYSFHKVLHRVKLCDKWYHFWKLLKGVNSL